MVDNSVGRAFRASGFGEQRKGARKFDVQGIDGLSREERIELYMKRADAGQCIFTGKPHEKETHNEEVNE